MKTLVFLGFVNFFFITFPCYSQLEEISKESSFFERIYFGGGIDVAFDAYTAKIGVSPFVGYMITSTTSGGIGSTYQFITSRYTSITTNVYGYRFFLMQRLVSNFFAYAEYENLSYEDNFDARFWDDNKYLGGGWFQAINKKSGFLILALYNFDLRRGSNNTPWSFRMGFTFNPFGK